MRGRLELRRIRVSIAASIVMFSALAGGPAHAQSAEADPLFDDGNRWMAEGKLAQACAAFEAVSRVDPRSDVLIRLGECREQNRQPASAWLAYRSAALHATDPREREIATTRAAALAPSLVAAALKPPSLTPPAERGAMQPPSILTPRRKLAIGAAGASAVSIAAAIALGLKTNADQIAAFRLCPHPQTPCTQADQSNALVESGRREAIATNVALGIAAVTGIAAGVLWVTGEPDVATTRSVRVVPSAARGEAGVAVLGRF